MKIVKVNNLPQTYEADTIYIVKSSTSGLVDIYVTDNTGAEIRTLPNVALSEVAANPPMWVAGVHAEGATVYSPSNYQTYRRTASLPGSSTVDPVLDRTRWAQLSVSPGEFLIAAMLLY